MARDYTNVTITVLWDLEDFPVPEGRTIREIISSVLKKRGYNRDLSITAYGNTNPYPAEDNLDSGITFVHRSDKYWRLSKMLVDVCFWALDCPETHSKPANLRVVAKNIKEETEFVSFLQNVNASIFNIFLVVPDVCHPEEVPLPDVALVWRWTSLLEGGEPMSKTEVLGLLARGKQEGFNFF